MSNETSTTGGPGLPAPPLHIAVTGATGFIGSALVPYLTAQGHHVTRLVRRSASGPDEIPWDPSRGALEAGRLEGMDAVINLAGENIAAGRWTPAQKEKIRRSRIDGTRLLSETLAGLANKPKVMVSASAIGYYGSRDDDEVDEDTPPGDGFLPDVCQAWEAAASPAAAADIRVVHLRTGIVLHPAGGALEKMLLPFRLGAGGNIGSGRQWMSWIARTDLLRAYEFAVIHDALAGPVNAVAPTPETNAGFTKVLGRVLKRPTILPLPAFMIKLLFGEMGERLLLEGCRVRPLRLTAAGFQFLHPDLESALRHELEA